MAGADSGEPGLCLLVLTGPCAVLHPSVFLTVIFDLGPVSAFKHISNIKFFKVCAKQPFENRPAGSKNSQSRNRHFLRKEMLFRT